MHLHGLKLDLNFCIKGLHHTDGCYVRKLRGYSLTNQTINKHEHNEDDISSLLFSIKTWQNKLPGCNSSSISMCVAHSRSVSHSKWNNVNTLRRL